MSAIVPAKKKPADGVQRYRTTCKVVIHGFNGTEDPLDISQDVVHITTKKATKALGTATVVFTSSKNYSNLIFPNSYINIYFNVNDGEGFTRNFFGFVDTIRWKYTVDAEGKPTTSYTLTCSDFSKAIEKTQIYNNPHLYRRADIVSPDFSALNLGGLAIASKGVEVSGSPADIVQNLIIVLLGFGTQFVLPPGYKPSLSFDNRKKLVEYVYNALSEDTKRSITSVEAFEKELQDTWESALQQGALVANQDPKIKQGDEYSGVTAIAQKIYTKELANKIKLDPSAQAGFSQGIISSIPNITTRAPSLIDILDIFTFVEHECIDGFHGSTSIWAAQGELSSILTEYSNDIVNELFYDLRPVSKGTNPTYSRDPDEVGGNHSKIDPPGIQYAPCVIMREYPYSTLNKFDGTGVFLSIRGADEQLVNLGEIPMGAIFSHMPEQPGRHLITVPANSLSRRVYGKNISNTQRILDVAVIHETDIKDLEVGRSDHEHFNLFEITDDFGIFGESVKFFMIDLLPITSPVHIMRNGLRVRTAQTKFARFPAEISANTNPTSLATQASSKLLDAEGGDAPDVPVASGFVAPVQSGGTGRFSPWGWRFNPAEQTWKFHSGMDIHAAKGSPVYAIASGKLVISAPPDLLSWYSESVMIKHEGMGPGGSDLYSYYAHLDSRTVDLKPEGILPRSAFMSPSVFVGGQLQEIDIQKGQQIGTVGNKQGSPSSPGKTFSKPHLHFELIIPTEGKTYPSHYGVLNEDRATFIDSLGDSDPELIAVSVDRASKHKLLNGTGGNTPPIKDPGEKLESLKASNAPPFETVNERTLDPNVYFSSLGIDLVAAAGGAAPSEDPDDAADDSGQVTDDQDAVPPAQSVLDLTKADERSYATIDNKAVRSQLARWAILQDHWYQHALEYWAGSMTLSPMPELRPGYRLDIVEHKMSYYIESVTQTWDVLKELITSVEVTRGQPNNPFPLYVPPVEIGKQKLSEKSRLAKFFICPDPLAVRRAVVMRDLSYATPVKAPENIEDPNKYKPEDTLPSETISNYSESSSSLDDFVDSIIKEVVGELKGAVAGALSDAGIPGVTK